MAEYQVTCINKPQHSNEHQHITHIGNLTSKWRMTRENAIYQIENKINLFYTIDQTTGKKCYVGVVKEEGKNPYLRTYADKKWNDNLLAQADCSENCKIIG